MSSDFDWLMRGMVYCDGQKANSPEFEEQWDKIKWTPGEGLVEAERKGNHGSGVKNFVLKEGV